MTVCVLDREGCRADESSAAETLVQILDVRNGCLLLRCVKCEGDVERLGTPKRAYTCRQTKTSRRGGEQTDQAERRVHIDSISPPAFTDHLFTRDTAKEKVALIIAQDWELFAVLEVVFETPP